MAKNYKNTNNMNKNNSENNSYSSSYGNMHTQNSKQTDRTKNAAKNKNTNKTTDCHTKDYSDYNNRATATIRNMVSGNRISPAFITKKAGRFFAGSPERQHLVKKRLY